VRIFITGATGVIGRRVVPVLRARGHEVTAAGRPSPRLQALAQHGAVAVALDLFDAASVRRALAGHDVVINLATSVPSNGRAFLPGAWRATDHMRREASAIISRAAAAAGVRRYLQESFAPVYPDNGDRWITEAVLLRPAKYNRSVLDAEASAIRFAEAGGTGVMLRFAFFYGTNDPFTRQLMHMVRKGWMPLVGPRNAYFPMVMHDDAAAAVIAALEVPTGAYNIVDDQPMTHQALGNAVAEVLGVRQPKFLPSWMAKLGGSLGQTLARSLRVSNAKLKGASAWRPSAPSAADGLLRALPGLRNGATKRRRN
jgi:2-alkyl-3-oxoalkanoate reductase